MMRPISQKTQEPSKLYSDEELSMQRKSAITARPPCQSCFVGLLMARCWPHTLSTKLRIFINLGVRGVPREQDMMPHQVAGLTCTFYVLEDWFKKSFLAVVRRIPGRKVWIGDNLASHITTNVTCDRALQTK